MKTPWFERPWVASALFWGVMLTAWLGLYGHALLEPGNHLFMSHGDGLKNAYTYLYYIQQNESWTEFEGMLYPFGEHFVYTDCIPLMGLMMRALDSWFPGTGASAIPVLNLAMILSILIGGWLVFRILVELDVRPHLAAWVAPGIILLSPPSLRLGFGHYAMAFLWMIPLVWWLWIKWWKAPRKMGWLATMALANLCLFFIHPYPGLMGVGFQLVAISLATVFRKVSWQKGATGIAIAVFLPILLFRLPIALVDTHPDRTDNPSGLFSFRAELDDIFVPTTAPLRPLLDQVVDIHQKAEALNYVGLPAVLWIGFLIAGVIRRISHKEWPTWIQALSSNQLWGLSLLAALPMLIFAFGFPFSSFPKLAEVFPVFKQFRAVGRFAWMFYFTFTAGAVLSLQAWWVQAESQSMRRWVLAGIVFSGGIWLWEGIDQHRPLVAEYHRNPQFFEPSQMPEDWQEVYEAVDAESFQAILPLPFCFMGSEQFHLPMDWRIIQPSFTFSAASGLPLMTGMLTRTDMAETRQLVELIAPDWYPKKLEKQLDADHDILVLFAKIPLSLHETSLRLKGKLLHETETLAAYALSPKDLFANQSHQWWTWAQAKDAPIWDGTSDWPQDSTGTSWYLDGPTPEVIPRKAGDQAWHLPKSGKHLLHEFEPYTFAAGKTYELSVWGYNAPQDALNMYLRLGVETWNSDREAWEQKYVVCDQARVVTEEWSLISLRFEVPEPNEPVRIFSWGTNHDYGEVIYDEMLIHEQGKDVWRWIESDDFPRTLFWNNHWIDQPK
ncbi:hypothetical protein [Pontibacter sp. G13]|uniref:hypothetical protein n=1 Tax=Pontibacter sp. G13 TaxID=3074898 RepID=UPI00288AE7D3|nr:hypothetical protein [Pontibacter sp. G13]WNJ21277.1 hypothetical protein RJD25_12480 [Pontibacter sp. G13]